MCSIPRDLRKSPIILGAPAKEERVIEPVSPSAIFFDENGNRVPALTLAAGDPRSFAESVAAWTLVQSGE